MLRTHVLPPWHEQEAIIGVCRDLRGITAATNATRNFQVLFNCLYPTYFPVFTRAVAEWFDTPEVTTVVLKFMLEFVYNKGQRLAFGNTSPNGILLFRETSSVVVNYGKRILHHPVVSCRAYGAAVCFCVCFLGDGYLIFASNGSDIVFFSDSFQLLFRSLCLA